MSATRFHGCAWFLLIALALTACVEKDREQQPPTPRRAEKIPAIPAHAEKPTAIPVPLGLRGLTFGSSPTQVRKTLGLPAGQAEPEDHFTLQFKYHQLDQLASPKPLDAISFLAETTIGPKKAACRFEFAIAGGLSRMACQLEPSASVEAHRATLERILDTLTRKYGRAKGTVGRGRGAQARPGQEQRWTWRDQRARLELRAEPAHVVPRFARIELINESAAHLALRGQLEREKRQQERQAEQERERQRLEELDRIQAQTRAFDRDL